MAKKKRPASWIAQVPPIPGTEFDPYEIPVDYRTDAEKAADAKKTMDMITKTLKPQPTKYTPAPADALRWVAPPPKKKKR